MQSIEQSTDIGEDVIELNEAHHPFDGKPQSPPGQSLVFGDLFSMKSAHKQPNREALAEQLRWFQGPSECLVYICKYKFVACTAFNNSIFTHGNNFSNTVINILNATRLIVRIVLGLISISKSTINALLCIGLDKLLRIALYEPRLTLLISTIDEQLFGENKKLEPSFTELLEQQRQARNRLSKISSQFVSVADTLQSPALNKQLMYCLLDIIVAELYPELDKLAKD